MLFCELKDGDFFIIPSENESEKEGGAQVYMKMGEGNARIISQTNRLAVRAEAMVLKINRRCVANRIA
jgi:hypothetical protein